MTEALEKEVARCLGLRVIGNKKNNVISNGMFQKKKLLFKASVLLILL